MPARGRTCVGCRRVRPKAELIRLVRRPDGSVGPDAGAPGRGAYVCRDEGECLARARKRLARALRAPMVDFDAIRREMAST